MLPARMIRSAQLSLLPYFFLIGQSRRRALSRLHVVGPGVQRGEALVAGAATATAIGDAVGAGRVPGHADHQAAVVAPVRWPPVLAVGHQGLEVILQRFDVKLLDLFAVVEVRPQRIGLAVVLVQDVEVQGLGPPIHVRHAGRCSAAVHDAFASTLHLIRIHASPDVILKQSI
jgi:hypothetical protein